MDPFKTSLTAAIRQTISELKADGIVNMGIDNLQMVVKPPSPHLLGAPQGTNAQYYYNLLFKEIVASTPSFSRFVRYGKVGE